MNEISNVVIVVGGSLIAVLLSMIAFFLKELHGEVKTNTSEVRKLSFDWASFKFKVENVERTQSKHHKILSNHERRIKSLEEPNQPN